MSEVILLLCVVPTWVIAGSRGDARGTKVEPYACNENMKIYTPRVCIIVSVYPVISLIQ